MAVTNPDLINFFKSGKERKYSTGELVLRGEEPSGVFYIDSGFIKVYSISDEGDKYIHIIYKAGEVFPLIWALKDIRRRIFYEAASVLRVWEAPKEEFLDFIRRDPKITYDVLVQLAEQFYIFADRLDNLQYKSARERVVYLLIFFASRFGVHDNHQITIKAPITHELLAESVNLARETVSRELEKLEKDKLVGREKGYIVIKDIRKISKEFSQPTTLDLWGLSKRER